MEQPVDYVSTNTTGTVRVLGAARRPSLLRALPFRLRRFQRWMRDEQMPNHRLECFRMRRGVHRVDRGNDDANVGDLRGVTAVPPDDAEYGRAPFFRKL
jgi:hypothetical protein